MSSQWTPEDELSKTDKYEWHLPESDQQHVKDTVAPGDLMIKPKDISLKPTKSPERSGIQHGMDTWNFTSYPSNAGWYLFGSIEDL